MHRSRGHKAARLALDLTRFCSLLSRHQEEFLVLRTPRDDLIARLMAYQGAQRSSTTCATSHSSRGPILVCCCAVSTVMMTMVHALSITSTRSGNENECQCTIGRCRHKTLYRIRSSCMRCVIQEQKLSEIALLQLAPPECTRRRLLPNSTLDLTGVQNSYRTAWGSEVGDLEKVTSRPPRLEAGHSIRG